MCLAQFEAFARNWYVGAEVMGGAAPDTQTRGPSTIPRNPALERSKHARPSLNRGGRGF